MAPVMPYVVGQWVRGDKFYGRVSLIEEILGGHRNWIWLLGTRRVGKTSVLKQLEHLTADRERGFFPVFWDLQGADDPDELNFTFSDALLDSEDRLAEIDITADEVEGNDLYSSLGRLRRKLRARNLSLLLLCDEVEELINLNRKDPALLRKLRRVMQSQEGIRSVLASSIRLCALAEQRAITSPFLHGFSPPVYIHTLTDDGARALIRQDHLPLELRPGFASDTVETIRQRCDNHPYMIQLVCKRYCELHGLSDRPETTLDEVCEQVATDRMVSYFFSVDFEMLSSSEQRVLHLISEQSSATSKSIRQDLELDSGSVGGGLHRLENLGFIRRDSQRRFVLASFFFRRWLQDLPRSPESSPASSSATTTQAYQIRVEKIDDRYALLEKAGEGASGVVYRAHDDLLQTKVGIKLLKAEYTTNEDVLERVRQEIVLSRDIGHPNILRVYHLGSYEGKTYLTMQWIDGTTLDKVIEREAPFGVSRALAITIKLASALAAAHSRKILHRDIKPSNILIETDGEPFLADFGLARLIGGPGITGTGLFLGTPYYASPEQADLRPLDERSDLYSLGLVLYEMLTGRRPFEAASGLGVLELQRSQPAPDLREIVPSIPSALSAVVLRCMEKEPADRFSNAKALRKALREVAATLSTATDQ